MAPAEAAENAVPPSETTPWVQAAGRRVVFLLDHRSAFERRILQRSVETMAEAAGHGPDGWLALSLPFGPGFARQREARDLADLLAAGEDCWFVPLRVLWTPHRQQPQRLLPRLLASMSRNPGRIWQRVIHWRDPTRCQPLVAPGADTEELRSRLARQNPQLAGEASALANFVSRQAILALERAERELRGARYKVPRLIEEEVLAKPRLVQALAQEAERGGRPLSELQREARDCLREMAASHSPVALDLMAELGRYMYTRGFDRQIEFAPGDLERVRELSNRHPIAFLMTHKSHIDGFLMVTMFYDLDMPPVHVFGGINMSFLGLGLLGRNSGAIFIRRQMSGDNVYKAVFKQYIDYLAEKRFPLLWALEGTRSRTGKLMPPRYGLINYVADSYVRQAVTDMILMPVAIAYDQIPEVGDYVAEQRGRKKRPESASWFMQYLSGLHHPFGKIHVRFGRGVALSEVLGEPRPDLELTPAAVQKLAFRLSVDVNSVTPVLGTSMICFVLCAAGGRALTVSELARELTALQELVTLLALPTTSDVDLATREILEQTLGRLVGSGVLVRYDEGNEPLYGVARDATMAAAYYRNAMLHFLVNGAIAELALLDVAADPPGEARRAAFRDEVNAIRDLLKFEFFFPSSSEYPQVVESETTRRLPGWETALDGAASEIIATLWRLDPLLAHGVLLPFLDAYRVVAEALTMRGAERVDDRRELLNACLSLGRLRLLQKRVYSEESVAASILENGILLADGRGLLGGTGDVEAGRQALYEELTSLVRRLRFLAALADNRRLGLGLDTGVPDYLNKPVHEHPVLKEY
jgi:glycerol-3-phosphate O-acyltransferase